MWPNRKFDGAAAGADPPTHSGKAGPRSAGRPNRGKGDEMNKFPHLALVAILAALAGCDQILVGQGVLDGEEATMACLCDMDNDGYGSWICLDAAGFETDLRDFDLIDIETCRDRHNAGEPLIWGRTD